METGVVHKADLLTAARDYITPAVSGFCACEIIILIVLAKFLKSRGGIAKMLAAVVLIPIPSKIMDCSPSLNAKTLSLLLGRHSMYWIGIGIRRFRMKTPVVNSAALVKSCGD